MLYKNELLEIQYTQLQNQPTASQQQALDVLTSDAVNDKAAYSFIPTDLHPWIETIDDNGARHYFSHSGDLLLSRERYGDWISWFLEFHHHLLLNDFGEELQGIFGLLTLLIFITGIIKWWPKGKWGKRVIAVTLSKPKSKKWGQTLWQSHRTLGVILCLPMMLLVLTGVGMIYYQVFNTGLNALFPQQKSTSTDYQPIIERQNTAARDLDGTMETRIRELNKVMPEVRPVMVYHNSDRLRLKQPEEWHPNGRSYVTFYPNSSRIAEITDYRNETLGTQLSQMIYPLHIAYVGGTTYFSLAVVSGLALIWITVSGVWFWLWCKNKKKYSGRKKKHP
ncbi:hypothetical protein GCM10023151_03670 [Kangiella marina]|uniref:PepSY domain-containing protein n=1 Tax=Kangiella marina TaxID=1079178 RepID=A0ABP8ICY7_9GAMM